MKVVILPFQFLSFALWQITSTEKLNASANAVHSSQACFPKETTIIVKQNMLTITVRAFFSVKYFLRKGEVDARIFFIVYKDNFCFQLKNSLFKKLTNTVAGFFILAN